jgi:hypothetical protein
VFSTGCVWMFRAPGLLCLWFGSMSFALRSSYLLLLPLEHFILDGCDVIIWCMHIIMS